jgi:curved DNA-binding protein CbpA
MPSSIDYYALLGLDESAGDAEVREAYRRAARANHPDLNPHDPLAGRRFALVQEAYETLGDPARRAAYRRSRVLAAKPADAHLPARTTPPAAPRRAAELPPEVVAGIVVLGRMAGRSRLGRGLWRLARGLDRR